MNEADPLPEEEAEELLTRFAQGDDSALGELVEKETPRILKRIRGKLPGRLRNRVGASDILQHTAANLVSIRNRFENRGLPAFRRMLNTIADNILLNTIERENADKRNVGREVRRAAAGESQPSELVARLAASQSTP